MKINATRYHQVQQQYLDLNDLHGRVSLIMVVVMVRMMAMVTMLTTVILLLLMVMIMITFFASLPLLHENQPS